VKVPLVDLAAGYAPLREPVRNALDRVCDAQCFVLGPEVERLERAVAELVGVSHAVGVSSGTDALLCSLLALGIGPGDEVITSAFSFVATAEAIARVGAVPRFVDVEPSGVNLDATALPAAFGPRTKAVLVVHLFGHIARMEPICALAERQGLPIVEDAAQALGAASQGRRAGAWGALGCFSFFPSKPLGGFGDGGMLVTRDAGLKERCRQLRSHGGHGRDAARELLGGNFRLDELQAAVLGVKLPYLAGWLEQRRAHAAAYTAAFEGIRGLQAPRSAPGAEPSWAVYAVRVSDGKRDALARHLAERDIETAVYYRRPLHLEPCFSGFGYRPGDFPHAERAAAEVLALPIYPELRPEQREHVIAAVREFFG
jgi:dTDP-4-amino-4,6-dideoxygalactose transaminase